MLAFYGVGSETTCNPNSLVEVNWRQYDWEKVCGALTLGSLSILSLSACDPGLLPEQQESSAAH